MAERRPPTDSPCRPSTEPLALEAKPWQRRPSTQVLAAFAAIVPMAILGIWVYLLQKGPMTMSDLLLWPLLGGGSLIFWILFLHLFVCGDGLGGLGFRVGRPWLDLGLGVVLGVALLGFHFVFNGTVGRLFPPRPPAEEIVELLAGLSRNPWLLALWLGPVVWIGVATFEELMRAFLLRRLWQVWRGTVGRWAVVALVSIVFGVAHDYQGPAAIVSIGVQSLMLGWFFMANGRIRALIVAHALYDSIQIIFAVVAIRQMGL